MVKLSKLAAGIGAALALGYGGSALAAIPAIGAIDDGSLILNNFQLLRGNGAAGVSGVALPIGTNVILTNVSSAAQTSAALTGSPSDTDSQSSPLIGGPLNIFSSAGAVGVAGGGPTNNAPITVGGYTPQTLLTGNPVLNFAGGSSLSAGNATVPGGGDFVPVESQVSLAGGGLVGGATARQTLNVRFTVTITAAQVFEMSFLADGFLRAALGQPGNSAAAAFNWTATVNKIGGLNAGNIMTWTPNGAAGGNGGICTTNALFACNEFADSYSLNQTLNALDTEDNVIDNGNLPFEMELLLQPGTYNFSIDHKTSADADTPVPEPTTLALLGLGLVGAGVSRRRKS